MWTTRGQSVVVVVTLLLWVISLLDAVKVTKPNSAEIQQLLVMPMQNVALAEDTLGTDAR